MTFMKSIKNKDTRKLECWQEVIDMYAEQEFQKIEEEKQYKEQQYRQQKEMERQNALRKARTQETVSRSSEETKLKDVGVNVTVRSSETSVTLSVITSGKGAQTQTVSSTGIAPTPSIRDSQVVDTSGDVAWQREQGRLDCIKNCSHFKRN